jgi:predicted phage terminase large subunit-like protein
MAEQDHLQFIEVPGCNYRKDYPRAVRDLNEMVRGKSWDEYVQLFQALCLTDLFWLLYFGCGIGAVNHPWLVERIKEVEGENNRTLDLWAREHWKSTIITFGLTVQKILINPEIRVGIFSHTNKIAAGFLRRIKTTFETNNVLKELFPHVLYKNPEKESPKWSENEGITVKRKEVYLECTVEAWGLIDNMPTSRHYNEMVYDDVVVPSSVTSPEMIAKTREAIQLSNNLGSEGGQERYVGTRYHFADYYGEMIDSGNWKVRIHPALGSDGKPVLLSEESLKRKRETQGNYVFACQQMLNPVAEELQELKREWLRYYRALPGSAMNLYLFVDPANSKKKGSDYSVFWLWGLDPLGNIFLVDMVRERLNLFERWNVLKRMMMKHPSISKVYYEQYGMQADIDHFYSKMREDGVYFTIEETGGKLKKEDRIRKLVPLFEGGKVYLPEVLPAESNGRDLVKEFVQEEYLLFPFAKHDDMLDAASRLKDDKVEAYAPMEFPMDGDEEEGRSNVIDMSWGRRKANSRFANV